MPTQTIPATNGPRRLFITLLAVVALFGIAFKEVTLFWPARKPQEKTIPVAGRLKRGPQHLARAGFQRGDEREDKAQGAERRPTRPAWTPSTNTNLVKNAILAPKGDRPSLPGDDIFRDLLIPRLEITLSQQNYDQLSQRHRAYVRATLREGNAIYTNVAIRLKGGPGSFREIHDRPAFTVNFQEFSPGQTFHGLKKIHLNNSVQDNSFLSEKICREIFESAGVPAPRAGNALVTFQGGAPKMYVLMEGINKQFLKRYFKDATGNVYDGHSGNEVTDNLHVNSGDNPSDRSRLRALARAARESNLNARLAALENTLDIDRFLSFVALEMILWHWDGYTIGRNNFRIAHDRDTDRMVFFPQGMDQMLQQTQGPIIPQASGLVSRSVLEIPELRNRYRQRLAELSTNVFIVGAITNRIYEVAEKIEPVLAETDSKAAADHRQAAIGFARRVQQRSRFLHSQLFPNSPDQSPTPLNAPFTEWASRIDLGDASLDKEETADGKALLHIKTDSGCTASWRTTATLNRGTYVFQARIKIKDVVLAPTDKKAGAGLRISGFRGGQKNSGTRDWTPVEFEFEVSEPQGDVELVCDFRADQGEIWYDLNSLRLKRK